MTHLIACNAVGIAAGTGRRDRIVTVSAGLITRGGSGFQAAANGDNPTVYAVCGHYHTLIAHCMQNISLCVMASLKADKVLPFLSLALRRHVFVFEECDLHDAKPSLLRDDCLLTFTFITWLFYSW